MLPEQLVRSQIKHHLIESWLRKTASVETLSIDYNVLYSIEFKNRKAVVGHVLSRRQSEKCIGCAVPRLSRHLGSPTGCPSDLRPSCLQPRQTPRAVAVIPICYPDKFWPTPIRTVLNHPPNHWPHNSPSSCLPLYASRSTIFTARITSPPILRPFALCRTDKLHFCPQNPQPPFRNYRPQP